MQIENIVLAIEQSLQQEIEAFEIVDTQDEGIAAAAAQGCGLSCS